MLGCSAAPQTRLCRGEGRREEKRWKSFWISDGILHRFGLWLSASPVVTVTDNMTENEEVFKEEIHALFHTAKRDWFVNPKDIWTFFGSLFFCCTVFTTVGKSGSKVTTRIKRLTALSLMYFFHRELKGEKKTSKSLFIFPLSVDMGLEGVLQAEMSLSHRDKSAFRKQRCSMLTNCSTACML